MASFFQQLSLFFLILVLSSVQTEARTSKFFSKFIHDVAESPPVSFPAVPSPAPAPAPFSDESQNAYGLYSRDSGDRPALTDVEEEILAGESAGESYRSGYPTTSSQRNSYNGGNGYEQNYGNNGYSENYRDNEFEEREGMSDTRFMENGKYFYGGRNEVHGRNEYPDYEFDSMEEFENHENQRSQNFIP